MPTPHLGLPYIVQGQAQKEVTHNEALNLLDAVVQLSVRGLLLASPPISPADGDRWIVPAGATGAWSGQTGKVVLRKDGQWLFFTPKNGWLAFVEDEATLVFWTGTLWATIQSAITALQALSLLGVNTNADATNKLAIRSPAVLHTAVYAADGGSGDVQHKLNKETSGDTASFLFQTGFSGRAEIGLAGDDDLRLKVSADGASWHDALAFARASGAITSAVRIESPILNGLTLYRAGIVSATVESDTAASGYGARAASGDGAGPQCSLSKGRGTIASPAPVLQNDFLGQFSWNAYDGAAWRSCVSMFARVLASTPGPSDVYSQWQLWVTPSGSGTRQQTLTFDLTNGLQYVSSIVIDANRHFRPRSYTIATLPMPVAAGEVIQCSDLGGGAGTLESTGAGSAWRRRTAGQQTIATDAAFTLTPLTSAEEQKHTGTLTAHRAVTLSLTRAYPGARFRITRTGGGAFNLDVGPGPLKSLATNSWAEFVCDGSAWFLAAYGVL